MNEFTKGGGNRWGLAATDPTLNDRSMIWCGQATTADEASRHRAITTSSAPASRRPTTGQAYRPLLARTQVSKLF
jgi:hypothetical protein